MIKVKVCGMTQQIEVDLLTEYGVTYLGFIFYKKSKRYLENKINVDDAKVRPVGVFVDASFDDIKAELKKVPTIKTLQLHGNESPEYCIALKEYFTIIKAITVDNQTDINEACARYMNHCHYFLFDTKTEQHGGSGLKFDWAKLKEYKGHIPFFLSGGINIDDAAQIKHLEYDALHACDINSRFEITPGVKNTDLVNTFLLDLKMK